MSYDTIPSDEIINQTAEEVRSMGFKVTVVATKEAALDAIKQSIPSGASVMNGSSQTLQEIGFLDYLKEGAHSWNNLHEGIIAEKDPEKQKQLRKQALISDYYLGSVHALAQTGEFIVGSGTGSQMPHIVFSSEHPIFVVGAQKIVPTREDLLKRLEDYVVPLEDKRAMIAYNSHTKLNKIITFLGESPLTGRVPQMIIVKEKLGF